MAMACAGRNEEVLRLVDSRRWKEADVIAGQIGSFAGDRSIVAGVGQGSSHPFWGMRQIPRLESRVE